MSTLKDIVSQGDNRRRIVKDAEQLVESEVAAKSGLSGRVIKTAFKAVKKVKPGLIPEVVEALLDRFIDKLEPFHTQWEAGGKSGGFDAYLTGKKNEVANALLSVTDERARLTSHKTIKKTYAALRPQGEKNVIAAVPGLGRVMAKYVS